MQKAAKEVSETAIPVAFRFAHTARHSLAWVARCKRVEQQVDCVEQISGIPEYLMHAPR